MGYTNAGKSTLLNALTDADAFVADMPFATLDPTSRRITLESHRHVVLTDTVGFINKLPHDLVDAFRATLEEVLRADLLLEVVDASDRTSSPSRRRCRRSSRSWERGTSLGSGSSTSSTAERGGGHRRPAAVRRRRGLRQRPDRGRPGLLRERIATALRGRLVPVDAVVPYPRAELLGPRAHAGEVTERFTDDGVRIVGRLPESLAGEVLAAAGPPTPPTPRRRSAASG